ncbi:MAG: hypothetical protein U0586_13635 [Candidatus Brocadiaceae bacterium]
MRNLAILLALVFLTSCAQVPKEHAYRLKHQAKMQASDHWNYLARKIAAMVKLKIGNEKGQVFMPDADRSPFGKAMRTLLATELNHRDLVLTTDESSRYTLLYEIKKVFHEAGRSNNGSWMWYTLCYIPQSFFLGETDRTWRTKPHSEVIITYELSTNKGSLLRNSEIFYVNDIDLDHYWEISSSPRYCVDGSDRSGGDGSGGKYPGLGSRKDYAMTNTY